MAKEDETRDDPDALIVGAGPSSAVAARRLARSGYSVVCLEQGDWPDYNRARAQREELELTYGTDLLEPVRARGSIYRPTRAWRPPSLEEHRDQLHEHSRRR